MNNLKNASAKTLKVSNINKLRLVFENLGANSTHHLSDLYDEFNRVCLHTTKEYQATLRDTLHSYSSDSAGFKGVADIFQKHGNGFWSLR